jgi:hypothetical protein
MTPTAKGQRSAARGQRSAVSIAVFWFWLAVSAAQAQTNFTLDWFSVDGGGGTSTGGVYSVTGTTGQPDAGRMSGGNYTIDGGFWSLIAAVPTPGAPSLTIARTVTNSVIIAWPSFSVAGTLQQNTSLNTTNWTDVGQTPSDDGTTKSVIVSPPTGKMFYRLLKQ